ELTFRNRNMQCRVSRRTKFTTERESDNMRTILLLTISNIFMTFAWYGHLKFRTTALWKVVVISWGIAFFEYCFQVPANRIGSYEFTAAQLKTIQEVITLTVFSVFSIFISVRRSSGTMPPASASLL
ncbi:MAG: DMT family protein, partial [Candidatus Acidiferrum sp.]